MINLEHQINKFKARKFTVIRGDGKKTGTKSDYPENHPDIDDEVDRILDKIARDGMDSLTDRERRILDRASDRKKQ